MVKMQEPEKVAQKKSIKPRIGNNVFLVVVFTPLSTTTVILGRN